MRQQIIHADVDKLDEKYDVVAPSDLTTNNPERDTNMRGTPRTPNYYSCDREVITLSQNSAHTVRQKVWEGRIYKRWFRFRVFKMPTVEIIALSGKGERLAKISEGLRLLEQS